MAKSIRLNSKFKHTRFSKQPVKLNNLQLSSKGKSNIALNDLSNEIHLHSNSSATYHFYKYK